MKREKIKTQDYATDQVRSHMDHTSFSHLQF